MFKIFASDLNLYELVQGLSTFALSGKRNNSIQCNNSQIGHPNPKSLSSDRMSLEDSNQMDPGQLTSEQRKLTEANRGKLWFKTLKFNLFIQDVDPFALFKPQDAFHLRRKSLALESGQMERSYEINAKWRHSIGLIHWNGLYQTDALKLANTRADVLRWRLTRLLRVFVGLILAKVTLIAYVQYSLLRGRYLISDRERSLLLSRETCDRLAALLGNPLTSMRDLAIILYAGPTSYTFALITLLRDHYQSQPMDNAPLRLVLDPHHELGRIDASVRAELRQWQVSLKIYRVGQWRRHQRIRAELLAGGGSSALPRPQMVKANFAARVQLDGLRQREEHFCSKLTRLLEQLRAKRSELRPANMTPAYFQRMSTFVRATVLANTASCSTLSLGFLTPFFFLPYLEKCPARDCNPFGILSGPELVLGLEMVLIVVLGTVLSVGNMTHSALLAVNQLTLIKSMRADVKQCRRSLGLGLISEKEDHERDWPPDDYVSQLTKLAIKLLVCNRELKSNSRCISLEANQHLPFPVTGILAIALNNQFKIPETYLFRNYIIIFTWIEINLVLISCAFVHSRLLELQRDLWHFLAANHELHQACYRRHGGQLVGSIGKLRCCSFVMDKLSRFVHLLSFDVWRYCPTIMNVAIDYQKIIQANFFAIFIFSFTIQVLGTSEVAG